MVKPITNIKNNPNVLSHATDKQQKVAELIIENAGLDNPLNGGEIVRRSGYGKSMSAYPRRILHSEGVKQELKLAGFTESNAMTVVSEIMLSEKAKDRDRLKASEMVFKVEGTFAPEKKAIVNLNVEVDNKEAKELADEYEEKLRKKLI